jgi:cell division protein FtsZ
VIDPDMGDEIRITVIATGFEQPTAPQTRRRAPRRQPVGVEVGTRSFFEGRSGDRQGPQRQPTVGEAHEPTGAAAGASPPAQAEPFPVRSFDKEDLDIPAFLRRRQR